MKQNMQILWDNQKRFDVPFLWVTNTAINIMLFVTKFSKNVEFRKNFKKTHQVSKKRPKIFLLPIEMGRQNHFRSVAFSHNEKRFDVPFQWVTKKLLDAERFRRPNDSKTSSFERLHKDLFSTHWNGASNSFRVGRCFTQSKKVSRRISMGYKNASENLSFCDQNVPKTSYFGILQKNLFATHWNEASKSQWVGRRLTSWKKVWCPISMGYKNISEN